MSSKCRLCSGGRLTKVLDLGEQCLGGQFPARNEEDPPRVPLIVLSCSYCGLWQLSETVSPDLMFSRYWYRSGVTHTMRRHLGDLASQAVSMLGRNPRSVLDIGCNDMTLLNWFSCDAVGIDTNSPDDNRVMSGRFPEIRPSGKFDLIFTVAMFYDVDDPVTFVRVVREHLSRDGLWCVEVGYLGSLVEQCLYDSVCHEHLAYYSLDTLKYCCELAGLYLVHYEHNTCNGGSIRCYFGHVRCGEMTNGDQKRIDGIGQHMQVAVNEHRDSLTNIVENIVGTVHLLGASTKANTVLQYCGLDASSIAAASERDCKKHGRVTPGTRIPIVSEEESRALRPAAYLVGPYHFRKEIIDREPGQVLVFPFPVPIEVHGITDS